MEIFQGFLFVLTGIAVVMYCVAFSVKQKKQAKYGNDERWRAICALAMKAVYHYNLVLLAIVVIGTFVLRVAALDAQLDLRDVFGILTVVLLGTTTIELVALFIYDKKM